MEPQDVDCVALVGPGFPLDPRAEAELDIGLPFIELKLVQERDFQEIVTEVFGSDRLGIAKGMIEVIP
ncbi:MAG: hypothetical protein C4547_09210 [Phycisphaerales bacterium]|nr:MAG: hypothetical protein C4547_09210 [Phycisphaerales bacterium]